MWVMTTNGFYSAVEHRDHPDLILVRARERQDLAPLAVMATGAEISETLQADYPYRIVIERTEWEEFLRQAAADIDYDNFKNAVKSRQGQSRATIYLRVWGILLDVTPAAVKRLQQSSWPTRKGIDDDVF